jgi:hypothetical protein
MGPTISRTGRQPQSTKNKSAERIDGIVVNTMAVGHAMVAKEQVMAAAGA